MKRFLKKSLISILIVLVVFNFLVNPFQVSYAGIFDAVGDAVSTIGSGLVGILTWVPRVLLLGVVGGLHVLVSGLAAIGRVATFGDGGPSATVMHSWKDAPLNVSYENLQITPFHIFFNKIELVDINFFDFSSTGSPMGEFREAVAAWYYTMRAIAAMALAVILVYIGIRMALSTVAQERALYKKMLVDWLTSLALLFFLHYIMIFVLMINDALVNAMEALMTATNMDDFIANLVDLSAGLVPDSVLLSFVAIGVYAMIVFQTLSFLLTYIKRMLNIGFLMIIAPLITITYSIDKIGDGKAQALNTWMKEFIYNVLIQPFHCILFLAFAQIAYQLLSSDMSGNGSSLARAILAVLCVQYIKTGEELVKQIFGFKQAGSLATMAAGTAMAMTAMNQAGNVGKKVGGAVSGAKNFVTKNPEARKALDAIKKNSTANKEAKKAADAMVDKKSNRKEYKQKKKEEKENFKKTGSVSEEAKKAISENVKTAQGKGADEKGDIKGVKGGINKIGEKFKSAGGKISDFKDRHPVLTAPVGIPAGLARDAVKAMTKDGNRQKIASAAVGAVMGFGAMGSGDAMSAVTGYKAGSGFMQGMFENTSNSIAKESKGYADALAHITGENYTSDMFVRVKAEGDGGAYKDTNKKLDELMQALQRLGIQDKGQRSRVVGRVATQVHKNPEGLTPDFIRKTIESETEFSDLSEDKKDTVAGLLAGHARFTAEAGLYNAIQNGEKVGRDSDTLAAAVGNFKYSGNDFTVVDPSSVKSPESEKVETVETVETEGTTQVDYTDAATAMAAISAASVATTAILSMEGGNISEADISETNAKIDELNRLLEQYNNSGELQRQQIVAAINENNALLQDFNLVSGSTGPVNTADFEGKMRTYISELKSVIPEATSGGTNE